MMSQTKQQPENSAKTILQMSQPLCYSIVLKIIYLLDVWSSWDVFWEQRAAGGLCVRFKNPPTRGDKPRVCIVVASLVAR